MTFGEGAPMRLRHIRRALSRAIGKTPIRPASFFSLFPANLGENRDEDYR